MALGATYKNVGTGDLTLGAGVSNAGTVQINGTSAACGETDAIQVRSTAATPRAWSGAGTFDLTDVDVQYQAGTSSIIVLSGTDSGNNGANWTFVNSCASLTVIKHVINDNDGLATASQWTMNVAGAGASPSSFLGSETGTTVTINPGTAYSVTESGGPSGYTASSTGCTITAVSGTRYVCTITNDDAASATLLVKKHVVNDNGGSAVASAWNLTVSSNDGGGGTGSAAGSESGTTYTLDAGKQYSVSESGGPGGYAATLSSDCSIASAVAGTAYTCTLTNNDQQAYITVVKVVTNDNGGSAAPDDFALTLEGNPVSSGVAVPVNPGTYTAGETLLPGYAFEGFSGACDSSGDLTVALGESKTCTLTNNDQQAYITVVKVVTNDNGGSAAPDDFALTLEGNPVSSGVAVPVNPGTYTAGETLLPGYTFEGFSGACDSSGDLTVALGESKTCTLTNNDQQAYITVVKVVTNDNGGSAAPDDFALTLEGNPVSSGVAVPVNPGTYTAGETLLPGYAFEGFSGACDSSGDLTVALGESKTCTLTNNDQQAYITVVKVVTNDNGGSAAPDDFALTLEGNPVSSGVAVPVNPGTYTAGETLLPGYAFEGFSGACDSSGDLTVALGESKTCTLTNNDQQAYITVVKVVTNDNGGTAAPDDFPLTLEGNPVSSGVAVPVNPGTYTAGETLLPGYAFEGFSGACDSSGDLTVALGESKTCTLTNNDQQAYITVVKVVTNDNGGSAAPDDFALTLEGSPVSSGVAVPVNPGTYTAGETLLPGYTFEGFSGACDSSGDLTVALGESKTCTLTNDDQQAYPDPGQGRHQRQRRQRRPR